MAVAILVGIPASLRAAVERHVGRRVEIRVIAMRQDGGFRLEAPPHVAAELLEKFADAAPSYDDVMVIVLPYARPPDEVKSLAGILRDIGATVLEVEPNTTRPGHAHKWPARSPRMDGEFRGELLSAICEALDRQFPPPQADDSREIACALIKGLVVHSKMGPNNHSHEDDLWKSCQENLGPGGREEVVRWLMREGILDRKRNDSAGGKGWVYWIAAVDRARALCPDLEPYFRL